MESINVIVDDVVATDYSSDDEEGMAFSHSSEQVMNKDVDNLFEPEYENEKKKEISTTEENAEPKISSP